jgi:hypothetical protein
MSTDPKTSKMDQTTTLKMANQEDPPKRRKAKGFSALNSLLAI